ncbi:MAG: hypothetical protein WAM11_00275 [Cyanobium sp.]
MAWKPLQGLAAATLIPPGWRSEAQAETWRRRLPLVALLAVVTGLTFSRLLAEGLADSLYMFGHETLRAVQAWENFGLFAWGGFFPLGSHYLSADHVIQSTEIYQSYPPLYLLIYWPSYHWFGEPGFRAFKLIWSLGYVVGIGVLLGHLASACFVAKKSGYRQLSFAVAYAMAITNQAVLRYVLIDEPDYLGLLLLLLGVVLLPGWWRRPAGMGRRPWGLWFVWFLAAWTYPILGAFCLLSVFALQRLRLDAPIQASLRSLFLPLGIGMLLYWIQRISANLRFPSGLTGSTLFGRMGLTADTTPSHHGVLDSLRLLIWQKSGSTVLSSEMALSHVLEHAAIWIVGVILFAIALSRFQGVRCQILLILAAGQLWLFIPLLHQSLAYHDWIYAIHFAPTVVLGWVGGLSCLLPQRKDGIFSFWMLGFIGTLIWSIQLRFFLVAYLQSG